MEIELMKIKPPIAFDGKCIIDAAGKPLAQVDPCGLLTINHKKELGNLIATSINKRFIAPSLLDALESLLADHKAMRREHFARRGKYDIQDLPIQIHADKVITNAKLY